MRVVAFRDADAFLARAGHFLGAREAEHNLILGLAGRLRHDLEPYGEPAYLATVERDDEVVGAVLRTPPHDLVLSETDEIEAAAALADAVHAAFGGLPGVLGPKAFAERFAHEWRARTGASARRTMAERIHRCARVIPPERLAPGRMRPYEERDRDVALAWFRAFVDEAMPEAPPESPEEILARRLGEPEGGIAVWEDDGDVVSLAGYGGPTPAGIRIGPVYTPPGLRGRGYASALVASLTAELLEDRRFCFLFTDLANPTSNSIYARVGYEPVSDVDRWTFEAP